MSKAIRPFRPSQNTSVVDLNDINVGYEQFDRPVSRDGQRVKSVRHVEHNGKMHRVVRPDVKSDWDSCCTIL